MLVGVDLVTPSDGTDMSDASDATINGITVNLQTSTDIDLVVTAINTAMSGNNDIVATADKDGFVLTSASGLTIDVKGGSENDIFDAAQSEDGQAFTVTNSDFTARCIDTHIR